jgi:hypothetical protein
LSAVDGCEAATSVHNRKDASGIGRAEMQVNDQSWPFLVIDIRGISHELVQIINGDTDMSEMKPNQRDVRGRPNLLVNPAMPLTEARGTKAARIRPRG